MHDTISWKDIEIAQLKIKTLDLKIKAMGCGGRATGKRRWGKSPLGNGTRENEVLG